MKRKKELKPIDILLKICLKKLFENGVYSSSVYNDLEAEITDPNTRWRAKSRIRGIINTIKAENKDKELTRYF